MTVIQFLALVLIAVSALTLYFVVAGAIGRHLNRQSIPEPMENFEDGDQIPHDFSYPVDYDRGRHD